ncbi:MAG: TAT-variant-translocated molybdopterin oxidoreductase, partial [Armatimonadetes bacterium]|nr:TAT-variant-translocated molybdopterin oxidoreductase [Armatimonadota bacterium]
MSDKNTLLASMQEKLQNKDGRRMWRSLEEVADTEEFKQWVEDEFPNRLDLLNMDRRKFLKVGGAGLALAGLTGCRIMPQVKAVPYVRSPEDLVNGIALAYASTLSCRGYGVGVLVEQYEGRPIKIEGNPRHPASLGATDVFEQAELLQMYDPARSQNVVHNGEIAGWDEFATALRQRRGKFSGGALRILTGTVTSPTLTAQINRLIAKYPGTVWHAYEPVNRDGAALAAQTVFGRPVNTVYNLENARVIVSLDCDIFKTLPGNVAYARQWANGRRVRGVNNSEMNRMYVIESSTTTTGASADHRFPVKPSEIETIARAIYSGADAKAQPVTWLAQMIADMEANRGAVVVIPGEHCSPAVHAYAMAINETLGAVGKTVTYTEPVETSPAVHGESLQNLVTAMNNKRVDTLVILGGNPVFDAPADLLFADALKNVPNSVNFNLYENETSELASWHVPATHALETWGDARAFDGTVSLVQPLIAPLYAGNKSDTELLAELLDQPKLGYDILRDTYAPLVQPSVDPKAVAARGVNGAEEGNLERSWQQALINGVLPDSKAAPISVTVNAAAVAALPAPVANAGIELNFRPDPHLWDGRYANNSWLLELPRPVTTVTWDNVAVVSPATAKKIGAVAPYGDSEAEAAARISGKAVVALTTAQMPDALKKAMRDASGKQNVEGVSIPVWILPGHPNDVVTVSLGFGRTRCGEVGDDVGVNVYPLRTSDSMNYATGVQGNRVKWNATGDMFNVVGDATNGNSVDFQGDYRVAAAQSQHLMRGVDIAEQEDRDIVRHASLAEYREKSGRIGPEGHHGGGGTTEGHGESTGEHGAEAGHGAAGSHSAEGAGGGSEGASHGGAAAQENAGELPLDPGNDIVADKGLPIPGLQGRGNWLYKDRDPATRTITNPEGNESLYPEFSK